MNKTAYRYFFENRETYQKTFDKAVEIVKENGLFEIEIGPDPADFFGTGFFAIGNSNNLMPLYKFIYYFKEYLLKEDISFARTRIDKNGQRAK